MSTSWEPLPSTYRSKQEFLASLPPWRRPQSSKLASNDRQVQQYVLEQRILQEEKAIEQIKSETEQLKKENARLAASHRQARALRAGALV